ncbi:hypothetical protein M0R45_006177 [Rubus argutus]|uniref:Amine oxidase domain-containing protein n=1 Tax=Rubus argutus TaxID=59490 RepID=A0AAW1YPQ1_RUBAR
MGASWLHGVCNENPLAPLIRRLGLTLYRTSGDNSVLYDHDLESFALFDMDGHQVPQQMVVEVGDIFKRIPHREKVRNEHTDDMSVLQAISIVLDRHPEQKGIAHEIMISLKNWDQEHVLSGGHGLMVEGYDPIIKTLAKDIDVRLNHRVTKISNGCNKGNRVLVYMCAGRFAYDLEKLTDDGAVNFVMSQLKKSYLRQLRQFNILYHMGNRPEFSWMLLIEVWVGKPADVYERLRAPLAIVPLQISRI